MSKQTIIVIGGNAAGPAAAAKAKRTNPDAKVILFEAGEFISTGTCELPYVLTGEVSDYKNIVFFDEKSFYEKKGVETHIFHKVEEINRRAKFVKVRNLKENTLFEQEYDKLILCTGSRSITIPDYDYTKENVFSLKSVTNLIDIQGYLEKNTVKSVAIIGAGYIGIETAESFQKMGCSVSIIELQDSPLPGAEPEVQALVKEVLERNKIDFIGNAGKQEIISEDNRIKRILLHSKEIDVDLVIVAVGFRPNITLAKQAGLELHPSGAIQVNNKMQTSDYSIFAAGDNTTIQNYVTKKDTYLPLATYARDGGYVAGENAAGGNAYFNPVIKNIALRIFDNYYVSVGLSEQEAKETTFAIESVSATAKNLVHVMPESRSVFGKIIYKKDTREILGASFFGGNEIAGYGNLISALIRQHAKTDILTEIDYNYSPPLSPFMDLLSILGKKVK